MACSAEKPFFWIGTPLDEGRPARAGGGTHIGFAAANRKAVDEFFRAAISAGAKDDGKPGLRPIYHPELLRRLRPRSRWAQDRSLLSQAGMNNPN